MADTLLLFGVQKIWDLIVRESEKFHGVHEQLTELKSDLNLLRSFLKDADAKKHESALVRNCVEEIKEIVFDTEDIIETFLLKKELGETGGIRKHMRRLAFTDRMEMVSKIGGITKRISKVMRDMQSFGVQQLIVEGDDLQQERQSEMRKTFPNENESCFVGLDENVKKLVGYLVEEESIQVVSICGMGGIGKTTLARQVFNHEMVKNHFDGVAWVCVSQQLTRNYVWQTILQRLSPKHDEHKESNMTEDELHEKLFGLLETSSSLIVLDDMWKEEDWDRIKSVFPPTKGWKVLLTSRNEGVALRADPTCVTFKPECLTLEDSWTLFQRIAFPRTDTTEFKADVEMEAIGKKMIKHCRGLPLAVKVLGGLLATQHTLSEWERVFENISHLAARNRFNDGYANSVHHVLCLSYEELPISLKHCFLYLAHFPEDYQIHVEKLSWYWAAEGLSKPEYYERASVRDVADVYIEELVKRNIVISERDAKTSRFETFHLHDIMREVCLLKAKEENFLQIVHHDTSTANSESPCKSRRLAIHMSVGNLNVEGEIKNPSLRSLLVFAGPRWMCSGLIFDMLQLMRVLDLSYAEFEGGKLPSSIGKLIHLRYLSLFQAHVTHLPYSMRNLKLLLYLNLCVDVGVECELYMPNFLEEMRELTYMYLPCRLHDTVKMELGNLVKLETLKNFSTEHGRVRDLQNMTKLRDLSIYIRDEGCNMETLASSLRELRHLENLTIVDTTFVARGFVLDCINLKQPLIINMPKLPDEQHVISHLTTISLNGCFLEEDPMPILDKLPHLKQVCLWGNSFCGRRMVCSAGGFPQLQELVFSGLRELEEWIVEEGSMPFLCVLFIEQCEKLNELPDELGFITSLNELFMKKEWMKKLLERREDHNKVQHIPSVTIRDY